MAFLQRLVVGRVKNFIAEQIHRSNILRIIFLDQISIRKEKVHSALR